ncbi:MAG: pilus assembly protein N-terminal domain-containing protein, partial [Roseiarcus sp.]
MRAFVDVVLLHVRRAGPARLLSIACVGALGLAIAHAAWAAPAAMRRALTIEVDQAEVIQLSEAATTVFVANPDIADVQVPDRSKFVLFGKKPGVTTVYAMMPDGKVASYAVTVKHQVAEIGAALREQVPNAEITVSNTPAGIVIAGTAASPRDAQKLKAVARDYLGEKENIVFNVTVAAATQVNLRVRVAEVSRNTNKQFGLNWNAIYNNGTIAVGLLTGRAPVAAFGDFIRSTATPPVDSLGLGGKSGGGSVNVSALIDALATEGVVTILAEPNLTAISG